MSPTWEEIATLDKEEMFKLLYKYDRYVDGCIYIQRQPITIAEYYEQNIQAKKAV